MERWNVHRLRSVIGNREVELFAGKKKREGVKIWNESGWLSKRPGGFYGARIPSIRESKNQNEGPLSKSGRPESIDRVVKTGPNDAGENSSENRTWREVDIFKEYSVCGRDE